MNPAELAAAIGLILQKMQGAGLVPSGQLPTEVVVERPKNREHGDWASNVAMQLAPVLSLSPRTLAELLAPEIEALDEVSKVEIAGPGFINISLNLASAGMLAKTIVEAGTSYGQGASLLGHKMNLEFVSANPTGPIHMGGTRWAAAGDSLARILACQGAAVTREYYFNDHGEQIDRFARSLFARGKGLPAPEDGYGGAYIEEIANQVIATSGKDVLNLPDDQAQEEFRSVGVQLMFEQIRTSLHEFGVDFDVYFHENSLHESDAVSRAIGKLRELGHVFDQDGAVWLRSTEFGDDRDRVIIKSDGKAAYIAGDLAYYLDKRERGFDRCLIMLGADHHGYVQRMMAMCAAFGDEPGVNLEILIGQMVNLVRDGEPVRMSKRAGTVVTMEDLVDAVGVDAARYALARSSSNSQLDIDLAQLSKKTNDNPVFYVQYAHARTKQVSVNAKSMLVDHLVFEPSLLDHATETDLLAKLSEFPRLVAQAAQFREPHRVARYIEEVAGSYHRWYDNCRVIPQSGNPVEAIHQTRLWLNDAAGIVLRNGLGLLGVSAPERM